MSSIAFALRASHDDFIGGVLAVGDTSIDIAEELKAGKGQIVVDEQDTVKVLVLDQYPPLKRVPVKAGKKSPITDDNTQEA